MAKVSFGGPEGREGGGRGGGREGESAFPSCFVWRGAPGFPLHLRLADVGGAWVEWTLGGGSVWWCCHIPFPGQRQPLGFPQELVVPALGERGEGSMAASR